MASFTRKPAGGHGANTGGTSVNDEKDNEQVTPEADVKFADTLNDGLLVMSK
jgi:hypothetical protein